MHKGQSTQIYDKHGETLKIGDAVEYGDGSKGEIIWYKDGQCVALRLTHRKGGIKNDNAYKVYPFLTHSDWFIDITAT